MNTSIGARACTLISIAACGLTGPALSATPASLSRSVEVKGDPASVWAAIGPFCAIADWHPAIATCATDGKAPPTRTLMTREGNARFVELQTARDDARRTYSYTFASSPVPVTHYRSTLSVKASGPNGSLVTWRGTYSPNAGQADAAASTLSGIYESGLAAIQHRLAATIAGQGANSAPRAAR